MSILDKRIYGDKMQGKFGIGILGKLKSSNSKLISNFSWLTFNQIVSTVFSFAISIASSRIFGPEGIGVFSYAIAYTSLFNTISQMGLESIVIKELGQKKDDAGAVINASINILVFGSMLAIGAAIGGIFFLQVEMYRVQYILLLCIPFLFNPLNVFKYWLFSQSNTKGYAIVRTIIQFLFFGIKLLSILYFHSLFLYALAEIGENSVLLLSLYLVYKAARVYFPHLFFDKDKVKKLLRVCLPLMFSSITVTIYMKIDQLMVGDLLGDAELGIYSVVVKLSEFWYVIPATLYMAFLPTLSYVSCRDERRYKSDMQKFADYLSIMGYLAIFAMFFVAKYGVTMLYGEDYFPAGQLIMIYVWGGLFTSIGYHFSVFITIKEWSKYSLLLTTAGCLLNIGLNRILISKMGSMGAVLATVAVCFFSTYLANGICAIFNCEVRDMMAMEVKALFPFIRVYKGIRSYFS